MPLRFVGVCLVVRDADGFFGVAAVVVELLPDDRIDVVGLAPLDVAEIPCPN